MKTLILIIMLLVATETIYPSVGNVVEIHDDVVAIEMPSGDVMEIYGAEDYEVGDLVAMMMYSNETPTITDDVVIAARYAGWNI